MAEQAQSRVQHAIKEFVNDVDQTHLRPMERNMHLCAAECCGKTNATIDDVHRCVERCQEGTVRAQKFVQNELERFQEQLSRCVLQCQDEVKDKVTPSTSDADIDKYRLEFEQCAIACCDKNIGKLGPLTRRVKETLMSGRY
jgi:hypothetical protein